MRAIPVRLILFGLVAVVAVAFGFLTHTVAEARIWVQRYGYYTIAFTFAWAVWAAFKAGPGWLKITPKLSRREAMTLVATIAGLTLVAVLTVPYSYKVLYDEFVLQATAWCMHEAREVGAIVRGYEVQGVFATFQNYLDKRPFFFAFLVSLLHDLSGYREANMFGFNTALMPVVLGLLYLVARRFAGHMAALAAVCGLGALSLLAQNATGSGMEMLNLAMLLSVILFASWYLEAPDEPRLTLLLLSTVLLAQSRYESGLYVLPAALVVLEGWRRAGRLILPAAAMLTPALLIPYALHNTYLSGTPMLWELREGDVSRFGVTYLADNLRHAGAFLFSFTGRLPNSWWLTMAGIPALLAAAWLAIKCCKSWRTANATHFVLIIFGAAIWANLGLLMFYYWGNLDDPIVARLSLPFCALLALCIAWACGQVRPNWRAAAPRWAIAGALLAYLTSGLRSNASYWAMNLQATEIAWEVDTVRAMSPESRLVITNKSALIWLNNQIASIQITRALFRGEGLRFHLEHSTFKEVLVFQKYRPTGAYGGYQLIPEDRLPENFILEPVRERRFGTSITRISRLVEVNVEEPDAKTEGKDPA
ncbi:MAG: glycosyltransferase family 39 protein [Opitutaceae bacterium]|nr:glycosyltransferase family 39 protein [Opitutaceae bacterium]